jgi:hypothetical protein
LFNIKVAVEEIINILEDKAALKNIKIEKLYEGFEKDLVKTDAKRFQ